MRKTLLAHRRRAVEERALIGVEGEAVEGGAHPSRLSPRPGGGRRRAGGAKGFLWASRCAVTESVILRSCSSRRCSARPLCPWPLLEYFTRTKSHAGDKDL